MFWLIFRSVEEASKMILNEFERKKSVFDILMYFLKRILSFIFVYIIFKSVSYHKSYLTKIEFDNYFLTNYFKKIDKRRKLNNQRTLLPLKKVCSKWQQSAKTKQRSISSPSPWSDFRNIKITFLIVFALSHPQTFALEKNLTTKIFYFNCPIARLDLETKWESIYVD